MSNAKGKLPRQDEAIAILVLEQVLGVRIEYADAGAGSSSVDGIWRYEDGRRGAVEVTSAECADEMARRFRAQKSGGRECLSGGHDLLDLSGQISTILQEEWVSPNLEKLASASAHENHLYLWGRSQRDDFLFVAVADLLPSTAVELPGCLTDLWLDAGVFRDEGTNRKVRIAHFNARHGWRQFFASYDEASLPQRAGA